MSLPVILRPEAEDDVISAHDWYEQRKDGLGQAFLARLSTVLDRIGASPALHAIVWEDVRSSRLRQFPFIVYYRVLADQIEVLAVLHGSRDPAVWRSRL